jgi:carotenoid cleavage dioxygenase-like enzyme
MLHAVLLENGKARYRNRRVRTMAFPAESRRAGAFPAVLG